MTFQDLFDQLKALTPEQLSQEVFFVKQGACDEYSYPGIAEEDYFEDSSRVSLKLSEGGVYYVNSYNNGISDLGHDELVENLFEGDEIDEIIPDGMPFFKIGE